MRDVDALMCYKLLKSIDEKGEGELENVPLPHPWSTLFLCHTETW